MTKAESISTSKQEHINDCIAVSKELSQAITLAMAALSDYFAKGYNAGGDKEIVEADFDERSMTLADHTAFISMLTQLKNFGENQPVTQGDYITVNRRMQP